MMNSHHHQRSRHRPQDNQNVSERRRRRHHDRHDNNVDIVAGDAGGHVPGPGGPDPYPPQDNGTQELMYLEGSAYGTAGVGVRNPEHGTGIDNSRTSSGDSFSHIADAGSTSGDDPRSPRQQTVITYDAPSGDVPRAYPDGIGYSVQTRGFSSSSFSGSQSDSSRPPRSEYVPSQEVVLQVSGGTWTDDAHLSMSPGPNYVDLVARTTSGQQPIYDEGQQQPSYADLFGDGEPYVGAMVPVTEESFSIQSSLGGSANTNDGSETSNAGGTLDSGDTVRYNSATRHHMADQRNMATYEFVTGPSRQPGQSEIEALISHHRLAEDGGDDGQQLQEVPTDQGGHQDNGVAYSEDPQYVQETSRIPQATSTYFQQSMDPQHETGGLPPYSVLYSGDQEYTGYLGEGEYSSQGVEEFEYNSQHSYHG